MEKKYTSSLDSLMDIGRRYGCRNEVLQWIKDHVTSYSALESIDPIHLNGDLEMHVVNKLKCNLGINLESKDLEMSRDDDSFGRAEFRVKILVVKP